MKIYLNGRILDAEDARLSPLDRGFTLGDGLFETIKVSGGVIIRIAEHLTRLRHSCKIISMEFPWDDDQIIGILEDVLAANGLQNAVLRLSVSRGVGQRGLLPPVPAYPLLVVTAGQLPPVLGPLNAIVSDTVRRNEYSPVSRIKSLSYLDNILARQEAADKGADEAILLNSQGFVTETTIANIFMVKGSRILTPPVSNGLLPGLRRAHILTQGAEEMPLRLKDLWDADEVFVTNALSVRGVTRIEGRVIPTGPMTARFHAQCLAE